MKKLVIIICISLIFISHACENLPLVDRFYSIEIYNKSLKTINAYVCFIEENNFPHCSDTLLPNTKPALVKIYPGKKSYIDSRKPWEEIIDEHDIATISVFILNDSVYSNVPWDTIRVHYMILKRYDLSINELKHIDWTVTYQ